MIHKCADGGEGKMRRDPKTPIGEFGPIICTRCGWSRHGQQLHDDFKALMPTIKAAIR